MFFLLKKYFLDLFEVLYNFLYNLVCAKRGQNI